MCGYAVGATTPASASASTTASASEQHEYPADQHGERPAHHAGIDLGDRGRPAVDRLRIRPEGPPVERMRRNAGADQYGAEGRCHQCATKPRAERGTKHQANLPSRASGPRPVAHKFLAVVDVSQDDSGRDIGSQATSRRPAKARALVSREVAVAFAHGGASTLDERGAEHAVGLARAAAQPLARTLVGARAEAGPGHRMARGREARMSPPSSATITSAVRRATGIVSSRVSASACAAVRVTISWSQAALAASRNSMWRRRWWSRKR